MEHKNKGRAVRGGRWGTASTVPRLEFDHTVRQAYLAYLAVCCVCDVGRCRPSHTLCLMLVSSSTAFERHPTHPLSGAAHAVGRRRRAYSASQCSPSHRGSHNDCLHFEWCHGEPITACRCIRAPPPAHPNLIVCHHIPQRPWRHSSGKLHGTVSEKLQCVTAVL